MLFRVERRFNFERDFDCDLGFDFVGTTSGFSSSLLPSVLEPKLAESSVSRAGTLALTALFARWLVGLLCMTEPSWTALLPNVP